MYIRTEMITQPIYSKQKRHHRQTNLLDVEKKSVAFRRHWGDSASGITTCTRRAASTEPLAVVDPQNEPILQILHSSRARVKENPNHWALKYPKSSLQNTSEARNETLNHTDRLLLNPKQAQNQTSSYAQPRTNSKSNQTNRPGVDEQLELTT